MLSCVICDTPLTNGLDTYGIETAPLCWPCFSTGRTQADQESEAQESRRRWLVNEREELNYTISELAAELAAARKKVAGLNSELKERKADLAAIEKELYTE